MTEVINSPLGEYRSFYKDAHSRTVSTFFEELVTTSKIDEKANIETVAQLRHLEASVSESKSSRAKWRWARVGSIVAAAGLSFAGIKAGGLLLLLLLPAAGFISLVFGKINPAARTLTAELADLEVRVKAKSSEAWQQMKPLNDLHVWGTARKLFMQTVPQFKLDPYMSPTRLQDLSATYGFSEPTSNTKSALFAQSGSLKGNPFVLSRYLHHWIGSKTYFGSITIYWTVRERNSQGQWVDVRKSQVLTASVTQPFPEYSTAATLVYGHESVPNLSFSRKPSKASGSDSERKINRHIKKVERKAQKATNTGNSNLTIMANREFDAIFQALDRNDEVQYRLLFTALAQQEMLNLLHDNSEGPGDVFSYTKSGKVNFIQSPHLTQTQFDDSPNSFKFLELAEARKFFLKFHSEYFRALYFGFAPLLATPLYQENRTLPSEVDVTHDGSLSYWEHEVMANYLGESSFKHPESITRNILKTHSEPSPMGGSIVSVLASGYRGIGRVTIIPLRGGDGRFHDVPVQWTEYVPVQRSSQMLVTAENIESQSNPIENGAGESWQSIMSRNGLVEANVIRRGFVTAALIRK